MAETRITQISAGARNFCYRAKILRVALVFVHLRILVGIFLVHEKILSIFFTGKMRVLVVRESSKEYRK